METIQTEFTHVDNLWDDQKAEGLDAVGRLVYRSNLLGQDWRITNTGGGNTSSKIMEEDPLTGEEVEVLWVKGSGGDLRTAERKNFASLYQQKLLDLQDVYASFPEQGLETGIKTLAEDKMPGMYDHTVFNLNTRAPSIDTPLHSFIPHKIVDHTHPTACIAIATAENGKELTQEIYGDEVVWIDWMRPGFELGLKMQEVCENNPRANGIMMGGHGLINWAETDKECYLRSLSLIDRAAEFLEPHDTGQQVFGGAKYETLPEEEQMDKIAEIMPWLRGKLAEGVGESEGQRTIGTVETRDEILDFINSERAEELAEKGTSCPDHFVRTRIKPMYVDWDPQNGDMDSLKEAIEEEMKKYSADYREYYENHKNEDSPAMRGSNPTVVLIPGLGMLTWAKDKSESRVTAEFYNAAVEVIRQSEGVSTYTAISHQEAFDIEYWRLEQAKIERRPPEEEMAREIALVVGAGSGIGKRVCRRLLKEDCTIVAADLDEAAAQQTADEIMDEIGKGIGVAGSGISNSGDIIGLGCDATDRESVREALKQTTLAYGGIDHLIVTAGFYKAPENGHIPDEDWGKTFDVNVIGPYFAADETAELWEAQGIEGCALVVTTSVNGVVPKGGGAYAYDTSKAAANHLVRELALEYAPHVRVNGVAPATVVEGSSMFPRERVLSSLDKYDIDYDEDEDTDTLRERLAEFYSSRTLTGSPITPDDQAEAIYLLTGDRLEKTTGQVLTVDGGLEAAFLR